MIRINTQEKEHALRIISLADFFFFCQNVPKSEHVALQEVFIQ